MKTSVVATEVAAGELVAASVLDRIAAKAPAPFLLGCPAGRSPVTTFEALVRLAARRDADLSQLEIVMLDEYVIDRAGVPELCPADAHYSCRRFIREHVIEPLQVALAPTLRPDPARVRWPDPQAVADFDDVLAAAGGLDLAILGCGTSDGHVGFNPPGTALDSGTRVVSLAESTRFDNLATFPDFAGLAEVPLAGATMGLGTILSARSVVMLLLGQHKAPAFVRLRGLASFDPQWPSSVIRLCPDGWLVADEAAAGAGP